MNFPATSQQNLRPPQTLAQIWNEDICSRLLNQFWRKTPASLNDTGFDRTNITVSFTGEQWRAANLATQTLAFSYQVGAALTNADARTSQSWTPFPALDFRSVNTNTPQALNGNALTNRTLFTNIVLAGVVVPTGQELFLRW